MQSTGGSGGLGSAAQTFLSGLANNLNGASQQAASTQSTGKTSPVAECRMSLTIVKLVPPRAAGIDARILQMGIITGDAMSSEADPVVCNRRSAWRRKSQVLITLTMVLALQV